MHFLIQNDSASKRDTKRDRKKCKNNRTTATTKFFKKAVLPFQPFDKNRNDAFYWCFLKSNAANPY